MTPDERKLAIKLYREKELFPEEIQRLQPFKKYKLYIIQKELQGIKRDKKHFKKINELFKRGLGPTEIARKLNISRQHVYDCLKEKGD